MNGAIAMGANPAANRRTVRDEMTLEQLFTTFLELYAKEHKKTWKDDVATFDFHLGRWRLRKSSSIQKVDVIALHSRNIGRILGTVLRKSCGSNFSSAMFNRARE